MFTNAGNPLIAQKLQRNFLNGFSITLKPFAFLVLTGITSVTKDFEIKCRFASDVRRVVSKYSFFVTIFLWTTKQDIYVKPGERIQ